MKNSKFKHGAFVTDGSKEMTVNLEREPHPEGKICCEWTEQNPESDNYGDIQYDYFDEDELTLIEE